MILDENFIPMSGTNTASGYSLIRVMLKYISMSPTCRPFSLPWFSQKKIKRRLKSINIWIALSVQNKDKKKARVQKKITLYGVHTMDIDPQEWSGLFFMMNIVRSYRFDAYIKGLSIRVLNDINNLQKGCFFFKLVLNILFYFSVLIIYTTYSLKKM